VAQAHTAAGRRVIALATAGETALRLGREIGAHETHSVERFLHRVASGKLQPTASDLVVVDEAGQLETRGRWDRLLMSAGDAKLVAIGDPLQLPSIEAGGLLPVLEREIGTGRARSGCATCGRRSARAMRTSPSPSSTAEVS
jgi:ATP-dependent exoDNAse (exonuclease V) alpha subunit